jgi:hypothetical protein
VRIGKVVLYPIRLLEKWLERRAANAAGSEGDLAALWSAPEPTAGTNDSDEEACNHG